MLGQCKYWNRPEIEQIKTLDGKELYRNYLSLPLGLDEGAKLVMYILHYLTLEETNKLSEGESCFTATWDDGTLKCNTPEFVRQSLGLGDKYYYPCGFVDTINVAIKYETELEDINHDSQVAFTCALQRCRLLRSQLQHCAYRHQCSGGKHISF